jgi:hypothetical protein
MTSAGPAVADGTANAATRATNAANRLASGEVPGRRSGRSLVSPMVSVVLLENRLQSVGEGVGGTTPQAREAASQAESRPRERRDRTQEVAGSSPASSITEKARKGDPADGALPTTPARTPAQVAERTLDGQIGQRFDSKDPGSRFSNASPPFAGLRAKCVPVQRDSQSGQIR